ncbi:MAG: 16S rRNA (cytidine(1402)-2'-O)-methyltransferase [Syntrophaceae bacterium]|nr:16S rRNA (cytidine(1402)-2'-O)-methyltransferase [Syntrophaceae bacterium]
MRPMPTAKLYIVATPIGNLEDVTLRALRVLKEVRWIAAEDTRRTKKLLNAYGIRTPLVSLYDQTERSRTPSMIRRLQEGQDIAYVADAGTPGISDPGYLLVNGAIEAGIPIVPIPGPTASIAALCVSGLPMNRFLFAGFLPNRPSARRRFLEALQEEEGTLLFYESPVRLQDSLRDMAAVLGNRKAVVARELTKIHEELLRGPLEALLEQLSGRELKGEVVVLVDGRQDTAGDVTDESILRAVEEARRRGLLSSRDLAVEVSRMLGVPKKRAYELIVRASD